MILGVMAFFYEKQSLNNDIAFYKSTSRKKTIVDFCCNCLFGSLFFDSFASNPSGLLYYGRTVRVSGFFNLGDMAASTVTKILIETGKVVIPKVAEILIEKIGNSNSGEKKKGNSNNGYGY